MLGIETAFVLGMLHALEPGHGKTAMFTFMVDRKNRIIDSVCLAFSAALSHSMIILVIALATHLGGHLFLGAEKDISPLLSKAAGIALILVGLYLIVKSKPKHSENCCAHHGSEEHKGFNRSQMKLSATLGFSIGLFPCPSLVAAFIMFLGTGKTELGLAAVIMFALGMALCILASGVLLARVGNRFRHLFKGKTISWRQVQGILIAAIGGYYLVA